MDKETKRKLLEGTKELARGVRCTGPRLTYEEILDITKGQRHPRAYIQRIRTFYRIKP